MTGPKIGTGGAAGRRPQLELTFARAPGGETWLARQYAAFPFHLTRPFRCEDGGAEAILQSLGAGLLQGDDVAAGIVAEAGAWATIRTQGASVAHAMTGTGAAQSVRLEALPGARLAWLPRPLILFAGARVASRLELVLHQGARIVWRDAFLAHDPQARDPQDRRSQDRHPRGGHSQGCHGSAALASETVLKDGGGGILASDRLEIAGPALDDQGATAGFAVHAALGWAGAGCDRALAERLRARLDACPGVFGGVSALPRDAGLFARLLARDGACLQRAFAALEGA